MRYYCKDRGFGENLLLVIYWGFGLIFEFWFDSNINLFIHYNPRSRHNLKMNLICAI